MTERINGDCNGGDLARQIASMLGCGMAFVDADGQVLWVDEGTRRQLNGGLHELGLPLQRDNSSLAVDCFLAVVEVHMESGNKRLCVLQQTRSGDPTERDLRTLMAGVEEVLADPSWIAQPMIEKVKAWLQAARPAARASDFDRLTAREREILVLVCEGRTDAEIGDMLDLSQNTVRNHLASVFRKIGVNRRSAAIVWARERAITRHDARPPRSNRSKRQVMS